MYVFVPTPAGYILYRWIGSPDIISHPGEVVRLGRLVFQLPVRSKNLGSRSQKNDLRRMKSIQIWRRIFPGSQNGLPRKLTPLFPVHHLLKGQNDLPSKGGIYFDLRETAGLPITSGVVPSCGHVTCHPGNAHPIVRIQRFDPLPVGASDRSAIGSDSTPIQAPLEA